MMNIAKFQRPNRFYHILVLNYGIIILIFNNWNNKRMSLKRSRNPMTKSKYGTSKEPTFNFLLEISQNTNVDMIDDHIYSLYLLLVKNGLRQKRQKLHNHIALKVEELSKFAGSEQNIRKSTKIIDQVILEDFDILEGLVKSKIKKIPAYQVVKNLKILNRHIQQMNNSVAHQLNIMKSSRSSILPITKALSYLMAEKMPNKKKTTLFELAAKSLGYRLESKKFYLATVYTFQNKGIFSFSVEFSKKQRSYYYLKEEISYDIDGENASEAFIGESISFGKNERSSLIMDQGSSEQIEESEVFEKSNDFRNRQKLNQMEQAESQQIDHQEGLFLGQLNFNRKQSNKQDYNVAQLENILEQQSQKYIDTPNKLVIKKKPENDMLTSITFQYQFENECNQLNKSDHSIFGDAASNNSRIQKCVSENSENAKQIEKEKNKEKEKCSDQIDTSINNSGESRKLNFRILLPNQKKIQIKDLQKSSRYLHTDWHSKRIQVDLGQQDKIQPLGQQLRQKIKSPSNKEQNGQFIQKQIIEQVKASNRSLKRKRSNSFDFKTMETSLVSGYFSQLPNKTSPRQKDRLKMWDQPMYAGLIQKLTNRFTSL